MQMKIGKFSMVDYRHARDNTCAYVVELLGNEH